MNRADRAGEQGRQGLALEGKVPTEGYPASVIKQCYVQLGMYACYRRQRTYKGMYVYKMLATSESAAARIMKKGLNLGTLGHFESSRP